MNFLHHFTTSFFVLFLTTNRIEAKIKINRREKGKCNTFSIIIKTVEYGGRGELSESDMSMPFINIHKSKSCN